MFRNGPFTVGPVPGYFMLSEGFWIRSELCQAVVSTDFIAIFLTNQEHTSEVANSMGEKKISKFWNR